MTLKQYYKFSGQHTATST